MKRYVTSGCRALRANCIREAAEVFALRIARRHFGRRARIGALNCVGWCPLGTFRQFSVFVGYRSAPNELTGKNELITIYPQAEVSR